MPPEEQAREKCWLTLEKNVMEIRQIAGTRGSCCKRESWNWTTVEQHLGYVLVVRNRSNTVDSLIFTSVNVTHIPPRWPVLLDMDMWFLPSWFSGIFQQKVTFSICAYMALCWNLPYKIAQDISSIWCQTCSVPGHPGECHRVKDEASEVVLWSYGLIRWD